MRPDTSDWRNDRCYDFFDTLPIEGLAWECLRRHIPYQKQYASLVDASAETLPLPREVQQHWGYDFPARPGRSAIQQQVVWSPQSDPAVLLLTRRPSFLPSGSNSLTDRFVAGRDGPEGSYFRLLDHDLQVLFLPGASPQNQLAAVIPIDDDILDRIDALARLSRAWLQRPPLRDTRMTAEQRRRFRLKLRAADGRMNGATYRDIGIAIYGAARIDTDPWKTSPLRDAVIAFVEAGLALINGGYLHLLRHRRRI